MNSFYFDTDEMALLKSKYAVEYDKLIDFSSELNNILLKLGDNSIFFNRICEIKEELYRAEEQILKHSDKAEKLLNAFTEVEELNLRLVEDLPSGDYSEVDPASGRSGLNINNNYHIVSDSSIYVGNSNYDFEDWLVEWLHGGN